MLFPISATKVGQNEMHMRPFFLQRELSARNTTF